MKKTLLAVTITAGTVPATAFAQSSNVTLYGTVDAGVSYRNHVNGGVSDNGSVTAFTSGGLSGSRWGIRGAEDLGNSLKGTFVLGNNFDTDTGKSAQGSRLFGRQAYVGLQSDLGAVTPGRQRNTLYDLFATYDPMAVGPNYSSNLVDNQSNGRADNAVEYTDKFGGLTATGFYSLGHDSSSGLGGEVPGSFKIGKNYGAGVTYTNGPLSVGAAYDQCQGSTITTSAFDAKRVVIGVPYAAGDTKVFTGYRWLRDEVMTGSVRHDDLHWSGVPYKLTPAFTLTGAACYTNARTDSNGSWMFVLNADYAPSKRTDAYVLIGYVNNKGNATYGVAGTINTLPGQNQTDAMVDVRHRL